MDREKIIELLKQWDFKERSKKEFSLKYNISVKTIDRYIDKYKIPYEKRIIGIKMSRDKYGRYCLDVQQSTVAIEKNAFLNKVVKPNKDLTYADKLKNITTKIK